MEVWKDIEGYEGFYQISNRGQVRSLDRRLLRADGRYDTKTGMILKQTKNSKSGYMQITLNKLNKRKVKYLHRLVAEAFLIKNEEDQCVNHKDGNIENNDVDNLEWTTHSKNLKHSYDKLKRKKNRGGIYRTVKIVSKDENVIMIAKSVDEAARMSGVSPTQIRRVIDSDKFTRSGYKFLTIKAVEKGKECVEDIEKVS